MTHAVCEKATQPEDGAAAVAEPFSFERLEALIARCKADDDMPVATKLDRYAFAGIILFGLVGAAAGLLLRNQLGVRLLQGGIGVQLILVALIALNASRRAWTFFRRQHESFARTLDEQQVQQDAIVDALSHYPPIVLDKHLRYVRERKSVLVYRAGVISGGLEKFGVLPLLLPMYLQLRDWAFTDWKTLLDHMHLVGNLLLWLLALTYFLSWWAVRAKGRLELYEILLAEASIRASL